jgi:hypothetical protein
MLVKYGLWLKLAAALPALPRLVLRPPPPPICAESFEESTFDRVPIGEAEEVIDCVAPLDLPSVGFVNSKDTPALIGGGGGGGVFVPTSREELGEARAAATLAL